MISATNSTRQWAYICFIPPGLLGLIIGLSPYVQIHYDWTAIIDFVIILPLFLVSIITVPLGVFLSFRYTKDPWLRVSSIISLVMGAQFIANVGSKDSENIIWLIYGILILTIMLIQLVLKRNKTNERPGIP